MSIAMDYIYVWLISLYISVIPQPTLKRLSPVADKTIRVSLGKVPSNFDIRYLELLNMFVLLIVKIFTVFCKAAHLMLLCTCR